jgi:hypothetical protein
MVVEGGFFRYLAVVREGFRLAAVVEEIRLAVVVVAKSYLIF